MASGAFRRDTAEDGEDAQGHHPRPLVDRCGAGGARRGVTAGHSRRAGGSHAASTIALITDMTHANHGPQTLPLEDRR